jgi:hypothetical protein
MFRNLPVDEFKIKLHNEMKEIPAYALLSPDFQQVCGFTMEQLAHFLKDKSDRPVVDMTHISGRKNPP